MAVAARILPAVHMLPFAGFFAVVSLRCSFITTLWWAVIAGGAIDLFSATLPFGAHMVKNVSACCILYHLHSLFFEEKPHSLSIYATLYALVLTLLQTFLFSFFDIPLTIGWQAVLTEFVVMPLIDGIWTFVWIFIPLTTYRFFARNHFAIVQWLKSLTKRRPNATT